MSDKKWHENHASAEEGLNKLRVMVAESLALDSATWPKHGDAPSAIFGAFAVRRNEAAQYRGLPQVVKDVEEEIRDGMSNRDVHYDVEYNKEKQLIKGAIAYAATALDAKGLSEQMWPEDWYKFKPKEARRNLIVAAALLLAEVRRMDFQAKLDEEVALASAPAPEEPANEDPGEDQEA